MYDKYCALQKMVEQMVETEAWEQMVEENRELEREMCEKKLAPNLPCVKKLLLGWFEPLRQAIEKEQKAEMTQKHRAAYSPYIDSLPADKMAVIVMYKLMGLLMMVGKEERCFQVVQAAVQIGMAVENEVRIHNFLEKTKYQKHMTGAQSQGDMSRETMILRRRVQSLIKRNRIVEVRKLIKGEEPESWDHDTKAKLGCRLLELLTETAYVQPPVNQSTDTPDIRRAFRHVFRIATRDPGSNIVKNYGVIECDPLVIVELAEQYDKGRYVFLPSYLMRTHGSRRQQDAVRSVPGKQMQQVYEALDTLGSTKWRVNKRIHNVVENIWSGGGNIAGLVDRNDVPIPELHSDDIMEVKRWKWRVRKAKKINQELHSQRCDTELKLSDSSCNGLQHYAALARDSMEAAAVNLVAGEKPADVYIEITMRVDHIIRGDSTKDPATDPYASLAKLLIDQMIGEKGLIDDDRLPFSASCYAAKVTLAALGELFEAACGTMTWLGDCAKVIASENQPMRWTTPLGLPVVQPYFKTQRHAIRTSLQVLALQREGDAVEVRKQRNAFPPNFVHSLNGSHMMMTAVACRDAGLHFAEYLSKSQLLVGVHDSFWTHACAIDQMNRILRKKFVEQYSMPILEDLLESFKESYPALTFPPLPKRGDFDLREVLEPPYFFN
ncbi:unnamed protein product [Withania somnifera]